MLLFSWPTFYGAHGGRVNDMGVLGSRKFYKVQISLADQCGLPFRLFYPIAFCGFTVCPSGEVEAGLR
jgi:hypothetical protein